MGVGGVRMLLPLAATWCSVYEVLAQLEEKGVPAMRFIRPLTLVAILVAACEPQTQEPTQPSRPGPLSVKASQGIGRKHVVRPRPARKGAGLSGTASEPGALTENGGSILPYTSTYALFWGTSWGTDPNFTGDKMTGLPSFLGGFPNSAYQRVLFEYSDHSASVVGHDGTFTTYDNPTTSAPYVRSFVGNGSAPATDPSSQTVSNEVCSLLSANGIAPDDHAFYAVYATTPFDGTFCGWHSFGLCGGKYIKFAFFPANINTIVNNGTCDVADVSGLHSAELAALANTTAHELAEAVTDPLAETWYAVNPDLGEVGDKCNFTFDPNTPLVTLSNGSQFKVQTLWSNRAYHRGYGVVNGNGEEGCLNGQDHVVSSIVSGPNPPSWTGQWYLTFPPKTGASIMALPPALRGRRFYAEEPLYRRADRRHPEAA